MNEYENRFAHKTGYNRFRDAFKSGVKTLYNTGKNMLVEETNCSGNFQLAIIKDGNYYKFPHEVIENSFNYSINLKPPKEIHSKIIKAFIKNYYTENKEKDENRNKNNFYYEIICNFIFESIDKLIQVNANIENKNVFTISNEITKDNNKSKILKEEKNKILEAIKRKMSGVNDERMKFEITNRCKEPCSVIHLGIAFNGQLQKDILELIKTNKSVRGGKLSVIPEGSRESWSDSFEESSDQSSNESFEESSNESSNRSDSSIRNNEIPIKNNSTLNTINNHRVNNKPTEIIANSNSANPIKPYRPDSIVGTLKRIIEVLSIYTPETENNNKNLKKGEWNHNNNFCLDVIYTALDLLGKTNDKNVYALLTNKKAVICTKKINGGSNTGRNKKHKTSKNKKPKKRQTK